MSPIASRWPRPKARPRFCRRRNRQHTRATRSLTLRAGISPKRGYEISDSVCLEACRRCTCFPNVFCCALSLLVFFCRALCQRLGFPIASHPRLFGSRSADLTNQGVRNKTYSVAAVHCRVSSAALSRRCTTVGTSKTPFIKAESFDLFWGVWPGPHIDLLAVTLLVGRFLRHP